MSRKLPAWLVRRADGCFVVDPDLAYPAILTELGVSQADYDQYWIEVAYQCAKLTVQKLVLGTELDPRPKGHGKGSALVIVIESGGGRKDRWALAKFKKGKGTSAATKGREAKGHYAQIANLIAG